MLKYFRKDKISVMHINKYEIKDGNLIYYWPNDKKYQDFIDNYANENVVYESSYYSGTLTIRGLDEATIKLLDEVSDKKDYWVISETFKKQNNDR